MLLRNFVSVYTVTQDRLFNTTFLPSNSLDNPDDYTTGCIQHNNTQDQEPQVYNHSHKAINRF